MLSTLNVQQNSGKAPLRPVRLFLPHVELTPHADGTSLMRSVEPLAEYDNRAGDWFDRWAVEAPNRGFIVEQTNTGERTICYGVAREEVRALAEGLLGHGLGPTGRPPYSLRTVSIMRSSCWLRFYIGIPIAPMAPAYALHSADYIKLGDSFRLLTPGMVVVDDGGLYRKAIEEALEAAFQ